MNPLSISEIVEKVTATFSGLVKNKNWGEVGLFYNPEGKLAKGIYLLTFKEKDGANDHSSKLNRENTYRLNLGISKETFIKMFRIIPKRPIAGKIIDMTFDFSSLDTIMPHPIYGWMAWVCVLNPTQETFAKLEPLIAESYELAIKKYQRKLNT